MQRRGHVDRLLGGEQSLCAAHGVQVNAFCALRLGRDESERTLGQQRGGGLAGGTVLTPPELESRKMASDTHALIQAYPAPWSLFERYDSPRMRRVQSGDVMT